MSSTGDQQVPYIQTSINYYTSKPTWKQEENNRVQNFFSESQATINIRVCQLHQVITPDDHPFLLRQVQAPVSNTTAKLRYSELLLEIDMFDRLHLKSMLQIYDQIPAQHLRHLNRCIQSTCSKLADIILEKKLKEISIKIKVEVERLEHCDMQDFIDQQAVHPKLVPAAPSAVVALKTKQCDEQNSKDPCTICREEFMTGEDVTLMPCSHIFHKDCIECWLKTTHTCPLCRFAMPTT